MKAEMHFQAHLERYQNTEGMTEWSATVYYTPLDFEIALGSSPHTALQVLAEQIEDYYETCCDGSDDFPYPTIHLHVKKITP